MYVVIPARYSTLPYHRCGKSGLMLPAVSLGLWHNFGDTANFENMRLLCRTAFDNGITHFDLANNYGPEPGSAEKNFGRILKEDLAPTAMSSSSAPRRATPCGKGLTVTGEAGNTCWPASTRA